MLLLAILAIFHTALFTPQEMVIIFYLAKRFTAVVAALCELTPFLPGLVPNVTYATIMMRHELEICFFANLASFHLVVGFDLLPTSVLKRPQHVAVVEIILVKGTEVLHSTNRTHCCQQTVPGLL